MIYFIQDSHSRAIKIGLSANPVKRLVELQVAHHSKLALIGVMDGTRATEESLHQLFTRRHGEWFDPTDDLLAYIKEHAISTSAIVSIKRKHTKRPSVFDEHGLKPELRDMGFWPAMARLIVCGAYKGDGVSSMLDHVYSVYAEASQKRPDVFPPMSRDAAQHEIERLIEIQCAQR